MSVQPADADDAAAALDLLLAAAVGAAGFRPLDPAPGSYVLDR
jgi:hypothetical protein